MTLDAETAAWLESMPKSHRGFAPRVWTADEEKKIRAAAGKVAIYVLAKHFKVGQRVMRDKMVELGVWG